MVFPLRRWDDGADGSAGVDGEDDLDRGGAAAWVSSTELERLNRQLAGILDRWRPISPGGSGRFIPGADITETHDAYVVVIDVPGVARSDLGIHVHGRWLLVRGVRRAKAEAGVVRRRERSTGPFTYEIGLPGPVENGLTALVTDGVLTVRIPKQAC